MTPATLTEPTTPNVPFVQPRTGTSSVRETDQDRDGLTQIFADDRGYGRSQWHTPAGVRPVSRTTELGESPERPPTVRRQDRGEVIYEFAAVGEPAPPSGLAAALAPLRRLADAEAPTDEEWLSTAIVLKRAAVPLRNSTRTRHASVLLSLSDALTFTERSELDAGAMRLLVDGVRLLMEPFLSQSAEERLLVDMLTRGWNLAPITEGMPLDG